MKHFLFSLLLVSTFAGLAKAQTGQVSGKIILENKEPVAAALVMIKALNKQVIADEKGNFLLEKIPYGHHVLEISSMEIVRKRIEIKVDQPENIVHITTKSIGEKTLKEVSVVGKTEKKKMETQGFAVNVIETKEASLRNLQTNELLDRSVGVRIRQNGGLGANVEYNLNGMSGRSVGIFIDGIEISTYGSSFNLNNIPLAMIERVEVYKGVLPAHLTGDLMGGAINVVLKKGTLTNNLTAAVSYGSFNTFQSDVSGMYRDPKTGLTGRGAAFYTYTDNSYKVWGKFAYNINPDLTMQYVRAKRFADAYRSYGGRFELGFTGVKWADQFFIGYNGSDTYKDIQHGQTMSRPYMGRFNEANAQVFSLNYIKKDLLLSGLDLTVNANYSNRDTYIQDTVKWAYNWSGEKVLGLHGKPIETRLGAQQGLPTMNLINRKIGTIRSNLAYTIIDGHRISLNHVYYGIDRLDTDQLNVVVDRTYRAESDLVKNVLAFNYEAQLYKDRLRTNVFVKHYIQDITNLSPGRQVVNGQHVFVRNELKNNKTTTGYGGAISYTLNPKIILIGSTERAVRMPAEAEIFGSADENIIANLTIRPEVSDNYNLGVRLGAYEIGKHKLSLSSNFFWRNIKDRIMRQANSRRTDEELEFSPFVNLGRAQSLGFEGELAYTYNHNLNVGLNFSKFRSRYKVKYDNNGAVLREYNQQVPNEPFFTINANAQYRFNNVIQKAAVLNLYYNLGYVKSFYTGWVLSDNSLIPTQFSQDLGLSYRFPNKKLVASFDVKNILNAQVYDNFAVQKPGRGFYFKMNYTLNNF